MKHTTLRVLTVLLAALMPAMAARNNNPCISDWGDWYTSRVARTFISEIEPVSVCFPNVGVVARTSYEPGELQQDDRNGCEPPRTMPYDCEGEYKWIVTGPGDISPDSGSGVSASFEVSEPGEFTITFEKADGTDCVADGNSISVEVKELKVIPEEDSSCVCTGNCGAVMFALTPESPSPCEWTLSPVIEGGAEFSNGGHSATGSSVAVYPGTNFADYIITAVPVDPYYAACSASAEFHVQNLTLSPTTMVLAVGSTNTFSATGGTKPYAWTSDDTDIASVDQNGEVSAVAPGETVVTAQDQAGCAATAAVIVIHAELFIDSDNNNGIDLPDMSDQEEALNDDPNHPGKFVMANNNDDNRNGIPDFADLSNTSETALVPLIMEYAPENIDVAEATVRFNYSGPANLPGESEFAGVPIGNGFTNYSGVKTGVMRLWAIDHHTGERTRDKYVQPGRQYTLDELGFDAALRRRVFYVEGINPAVRSPIAATFSWQDASLTDEVYVSVIGVDLVPNYDRDGDTDEDDRIRADARIPHYFWINNDDDEKADKGNDRPGGGREDWKDSTWLPFLGKYVVDSVRDLIDFFPVWLDIKDALGACQASEYDYVLKHSEGAFNALINAGLSPSEAAKHLVDRGFGEANAEAELEHIDADGYTLPTTFLDSVRTGNDGLILLEARAATQAPLVLQVRKKSDGSIVCEEEMAVSIDSVEKMFRHRNLRSVAGGNGGEADRLGEPPNYPDSLTSDKHFVFIHGYNVNGDAAHATQCEVFKRMYWSGSRAKFHGISWRGEESQFPIFEATPNYHVNVVNAFNTAEALKTYLNSLNGDVVVAAHSLGNMLTSAAITLHGANVRAYMIINGAVAMEAFNANEEKAPGMVHGEWAQYLDCTNHLLFCSEWHQMFDASDPRSKLTWRGIFTNWNGTALYDYYSSGEDVVANITQSKGNIGDVAGYAWGCQEKLKGRMPIGYLVGSPHAGWQLNYNYGTYADSLWIPMPPVDAEGIPPEALRTQPFFRKDPTALFHEDESIAMAYARDNYYWLLARAIPARTFGIGANPINIMSSRNMQDTLRNGWFKANVRWGHGSFKNVAYTYTFPMYNQMVLDGGLK